MLAACLCFRDSAPYLHEWLLFHSVQGVRRFYLYNNESSDRYGEVLAPWIAAGLVKLVHWPGRAQQQAIYDDCLESVDDDITWLAFIDDDEFLFATDGLSLPIALQPYESYAGIAVPWLLYGSSGRSHQTPDWVIERFVRRAPNPDPHVKCVVRPARVVRSRLIGHSFEPRAGFTIVDEFHRPLATPLTERPSMERFRLHHYAVKSWEEFLARRQRPQANTGELKPHTLAQWSEWDRWWSEVIDPAAQRFLPAMRAFEQQLISRLKPDEHRGGRDAGLA